MLFGVALVACNRTTEQAAAATGTAPAVGAPTAVAPPPASAKPAATEERAEATVRDDVPDKVDGATVTMESTTVDGLKMDKISCKGGAGLFGGMALLGSLAKQKDALHACAPAPETVRVHVTFEGDKTDDVRVAGASSPKVAGCVAAAVSKASFGSSGACVMGIEIGKP